MFGPLFVPREGRKTAFADIDGKKYQTIRMLDEEKAQFSQFVEQCPDLLQNSDHIAEQGNEWHLEKPEHALAVLQALQETQSATDTMDIHWPKGRPIKFRTLKSVEHMQVSIRAQRDWFAIEGALDVSDGDVVSLQNLMALMQQSLGPRVG